MNWVQIFLFSAKHQNFEASSWGQMHFLKVQWASRVTWLGFFSEGKALSVKNLGNEPWAKQNSHNNHQFLILSLSFLEFELELIRIISVFMSPCNSHSENRGGDMEVPQGEPFLTLWFLDQCFLVWISGPIFCCCTMARFDGLECAGLIYCHEELVHLLLCG